MGLFWCIFLLLLIAVLWDSSPSSPSITLTHQVQGCTWRVLEDKDVVIHSTFYGSVWPWQLF